MTDINDKIKKLLMVSRDKGSTENEQAQALKLAQRLMLKHGIEQVSTDEKPSIQYGDYLEELDKKHHLVVAQGVGELYGTKPITSGKGKHKRFRFAGREETREASHYTTNFICDQIDYLYRDALPKGLTKSERAQWRREFKYSCAYKVYCRMLAMVEDMSTNDEEAKALGCTALVVKSHYVALVEEVDDFLKDRVTFSKGRAVTYSNEDAMNSGRKAGDKVKINQEVSKTMPKQLAG